MKKCFFIICFLFFCQHFVAQRIINNPDCIINNINGSVTKVELTDKETIIHMHVRASIGSWIYIPKETYIEDAAGKGKKEFIVKADGIPLNKKVFYENSDEKRFKLYFPPLPKDYNRINYGESNKWGSWFIYKLDLRKNGTSFIKNNGHIKYTIKYDKQKKVINPGFKYYTNTTLPKDLPKEFFGNWYDKYGSLLMITTPDYIVSDNRIKYYLNIEKIGTDKYKIQTTSNTIEILSLENNNMTIRTNRLLTLQKKDTSKKVPKFIKGKWMHWAGVKEITVTDDYFFNEDHGYHGVDNGVIKNKIDWIASSDNEELFWIVLYHQGEYNIYFVKKINNEYVLQPRGFANAKYRKQ